MEFDNGKNTDFKYKFTALNLDHVSVFFGGASTFHYFMAERVEG